jgi:hypothetical protein
MDPEPAQDEHIAMDLLDEFDWTSPFWIPETPSRFNSLPSPPLDKFPFFMLHTFLPHELVAFLTEVLTHPCSAAPLRYIFMFRCLFTILLISVPFPL